MFFQFFNNESFEARAEINQNYYITLIPFFYLNFGTYRNLLIKYNIDYHFLNSISPTSL